MDLNVILFTSSLCIIIVIYFISVCKLPQDIIAFALKNQCIFKFNLV